MRGSPAAYRLSFMLPASVFLGVQPGRHQPCLHGCLLTVAPAGLVTITGPSRQSVFDQAARFLRVHCKGCGPQSIAAVLVSPPVYCPAGRDSWSIIVGASVAFAPTALGAEIPPLPITAAG